MRQTAQINGTLANCQRMVDAPDRPAIQALLPCRYLGYVSTAPLIKLNRIVEDSNQDVLNRSFELRLRTARRIFFPLRREFE